MKKAIIASLFLICSLPAFAWDQRPPLNLQACGIHAPYGFPNSAKQVQTICRQGYLVGYDPVAKIPRYVAYTLTPQHAIGCIARSNAFVADQSIKGGAVPDDYAGTGYDKGHNAPDGDLSWDQQVEYESFLMTNMSPQAGSLNRGIWKLLETSIRGWTIQQNANYTIFVGSLYDNTDKKIGNGVVVPHAFYKIVVNNKTNEIAGWQFPHVAPYPNLGNDLTAFRKPIKTILAQSQINFFFPPGGKEIKPGSEWPVDYGNLINEKRKECK